MSAGDATRREFRNHPVWLDGKVQWLTKSELDALRCESCDGRGVVEGYTCEECHGSGSVGVHVA